MASEKVVGSDPFVLVDSLTEKIAASLNMKNMMSTEASVSTLLSSSPEAFKKYLEGMDYYYVERWDEALIAFEEAIAIDSTFALPYMRIGMTHIFNGKQQKGANWIARAREYEHKLPVRERSILDVYANVWQDRKFDAAFDKIKALVRNYPNDKETRALYGVMIHVFANDTAAAFAQLDSALQIDPQYLLPLSYYVQVYSSLEMNDIAIEYAKKALAFHPDSPTPYLSLARMYTQKKQYDLALQQFNQFLDQFPEDGNALNNLHRLYILRREFDKARETLQRLRDRYPEDPYVMYEYYDNLANLAFWAGDIIRGLDLRKKSNVERLKTQDSTIIAHGYIVMASNYQLLRDNDSSLYYARKSFPWSSFGQKSNYPLVMVQIDPELEDKARPLMEESLNELRASMPTEMWSLIEDLEDLFEGYIKSDTAAIIDAYYNLSQSAESSNRFNKLVSGFYASEFGQYEKAVRYISEFIHGDDPGTTSALRYMQCYYHIGVAYEGLGNIQKAIDHYEELVRLWPNPDRSIWMLTDARDRLNRLRS